MTSADRDRGRASHVALPVGLALACHPEPVVTVTVVTTALSLAAGRSAVGGAAVAVAVLAGQLSVGWHNDWLDADRDRESARADKPVARGAVDRRTVGWAAGIALVIVVPLSALSGWRAAVAHLAAVTCAWGYNAGLKATALSFLPYAVAFALLPAFVCLGLPSSPWPPWWALVAGALLGTGAHLANALPDLADDLATGVRGLPHRLGASLSAAVAGFVLVAASAVLALGPGRPSMLSVGGLAAAVGLVVVARRAARRPQSRVPFRLTMLVALVDVALFIARGDVLR